MSAVWLARNRMIALTRAGQIAYDSFQTGKGETIMIDDILGDFDQALRAI